MLYGRLLLATAGGLYWIVQISRADAAKGIAQVISAAPKEPISPPASAASADLDRSVSPSAETSKVRCFKCGHTQQTPIDLRTFQCEQCGTKLKRVIQQSN
jgi:DNA-directed RNA polymerase subunit RPC12/RpoP